MNFDIYHNATKINEANSFDLLANELSVYRKANYTNIKVFHPSEKNLVIDNLPDDSCGKQTGFMMFDLYGCWYEVAPNNGTENFWMIGEYPYQY